MPQTLLTGAAGALGSVLARHLVASGHAVGAIDLPSSAERLRALAAELGPGSAAVPLESPAARAVRDAVVAIETALGPLDGAVLVAGGWRGGEPFHEERDGSTFRFMLEANLESVERALRAVLPGMVARRAGSVVVIGSRVVERPWTSAGASAYAASKAAVVALAQVVAAEVREHGVRVNAVLPSTLDTPGNRAAMPDADPGRWVRPESLSAVIQFLLSEASRDVSGAAIPVYGRA